MGEGDAGMSRTDSAEFVQLYSKIAQALAVSGVVGQSPDALLSIQWPGIVVTPHLDPDDPETKYMVSNLLNAALECNYVVTPKAGLVSDIYQLILNGKETPEIGLSPEQKAELAKAEGYLEVDGEPSPQLRDYVEYEAVFYAAQDLLFEARATEQNGGPLVPPEVIARYREARQAWDEHGHREEVETALATVKQLQAREPYVYWQQLADRFDTGTERLANGSAFQVVDSVPRYKDWFRDEQWTPFRFDPDDFANQPRSGGTGMRGCDGRCCCSVRSGDEVSPGRMPAWNRQSSILAARHVESGMDEAGPAASGAESPFFLSCSMKRISIVRPWMDSSVFSSRLWKWSAQSIGRGTVISTGGSVVGNEPATGVLPILPTTALLVKDVELILSSREAYDWILDKIEAGREVRYGPFSLNAYSEPSTRHLRMVPGASGVVSGSPQILGFISTLIGRCPHPDMTLPWPS
ncbi:hypothetical protein AERYTH_16470 [Aeromicrobium erythreum]|jgi:hypothetical protein|uniref:Uncharacterized protein n=2 Tax=Nocardioidaceae TaxID=85015 RepID=A0A0U4B0W9_9ACTN|nr:hypothetical protein AERYTH_16470 [Aeromicrobium erythreum]